MISSISTNTSNAHLERRIGLRAAVLFNMLEMIGVGPFITLPLVIAAAGYRLSVWAWLLGAGIAVMDGLVWAEAWVLRFLGLVVRMRFCAKFTGRIAQATG